MDKARRDVAPELQRILTRECVAFNHLADVETVDELEDDVRRAAGNEIRVDQLHTVGVVGNLKARIVLLLAPVDRRDSITQQELQCARYVTECIDDLVRDTEGARFPEAPLDDVLRR